MCPTTMCCYELQATCLSSQAQAGAPVARHNVLLRTAGDLFLLPGAAGSDCGPPPCAATNLVATCVSCLEQPGAHVAHHNMLLRSAGDLILLSESRGEQLWPTRMCCYELSVTCFFFLD